MPASWRFWTESEEKRLESMRLDGRSRQEIATALGRTVGSVKAKITETQAVKVLRGLTRWVALLSCPHTNAAIAVQLNVKVKTVKSARTRLRRIGIDVLNSGEEYDGSVCGRQSGCNQHAGE